MNFIQEEFREMVFDIKRWHDWELYCIAAFFLTGVFMLVYGIAMVILGSL